MTIQLTKATYVSGVLAAAGSQHTLDAQTESYLVHIGAATWVDAAYTQGRFEDAKIEYDGDGVAVGIVGRANEVVGPVWATDASGNVTGLVGSDGLTIPVSTNNGSRPRLLAFGNSLAGQSNVALEIATTTLSVAALAGASTVTVAAIGAIADTNKIAIGLYDGTIHTTTVSGAPVGSVVTLAAALPKMARVGAAFNTYTTALPSNIRRNAGPLYCGMALMGMPVELIQGYGYGGGTAFELLADLPRVLESVRPRYVHLMLPENSLGSGSDRLISLTKGAISTCLAYGAIPIVNIAYPSTSFSNATLSGYYDAYNDWVRGQMLADYPQAIACDVGEQWLDTSSATTRVPLAGWTDGVHPNANKYVTIGTYFSEALAGKLPPTISLLNHVLTSNPEMSGSGGTASGMQGGSVVPASWTYTADAGVTATSSTTGDGESNIAMSVPGTSNISTTTLKISQRYTLPAGSGSLTQALLGYFKIKINAMTGVTMLYPYINFSGGEIYSCGQNMDWATNGDLVGQTLHLETPIVRVPPGATWVDLAFHVRPTSGLSNGVDVDIDLMEGGIVPAAYVTH